MASILTDSDPKSNNHSERGMCSYAAMNDQAFVKRFGELLRYEASLTAGFVLSKKFTLGY